MLTSDSIWDAPVRFYDPHRGIAGPGVPLPRDVAEVVEALNGTVGTVRDAVRRIAAACPDGRVDASMSYEMITLSIGDLQVGGVNFGRNNWRAIRFEFVPQDGAPP